MPILLSTSLDTDISGATNETMFPFWYYNAHLIWTVLFVCSM